MADTDIIPPSAATLSRYGLTFDAWWVLLVAQGGVCKMCGRVPKGKRLNIDHQHGRQRGRKWKDLPAAERRATVRGLICPIPCNKLILVMGVTPERLRQGAAYLEAWQGRPKVAPPKRLTASERLRHEIGCPVAVNELPCNCGQWLSP